MTIICFFGPDGSGKTSLAERLFEDCSLEGQRVKYSWMRGSHTIASVASRILSRIDSFKGEDNPYYMTKIPEGLVPIWQGLECVGVIPVILFRFVIPKLLGFEVVADRYSLDFIVWVSITTNDDGFSRGPIARWAAHLANHGTVLFFVTAKPDVLAERSGMDVDLLERQTRLYQSIIETFALKVHTIETTEATVDDSWNKVKQILRRRAV